MAEEPDAAYRCCAAFVREIRSLTESNPVNRGERIYKDTAAMEFGGSEKATHLSSIRTFERGKGNGSPALDWLCTLADKYGVALTGTANPYDTTIINDGISQENDGTPDCASLRASYMRHGFAVSALEMRREPKGGAQYPSERAARL